MTYDEVMQELESYGDERTKSTLVKHGAKEPFFGVKVADLKKILKKTKKNHELSLELFSSGNSDAMYLAGLMADEKQITKAQLQDWMDKAYWYYLSEYAVPWVASETEFGIELGLEWIDSKDDRVAAAGWSTLGSYAALHDDSELDIGLYRKLLDRVKERISTGQNRERHTMNGFVIAVGTYIVDLLDHSMEVAKAIGKITVDMGGTACKTPYAPDYIMKVVDKGRHGKKRKAARC